MLDLNKQTKVIFILGTNDKFYVVKMFQTTSGLLSIKLSKVYVPGIDDTMILVDIMLVRLKHYDESSNDD